MENTVYTKKDYLVKGAVPGLAVFLFSFLWMRFLTQGLPLTFGDDMMQIITAAEVSWGELLAKWFFPWSPAWFIHSVDAYLSTRIFETVILKIIYGFAGYEAGWYHMAKDISFAGVSWGIFTWTRAISGKVWPGLAAAWLFISSPFVYISASWIADFEMINQFLLISALLCFVKSYNPRFSWKGMALSLVLAWCAFKTRESSKLFPFILAGFLTWEMIFPVPGRPAVSKKAAALLALLGFVLIVPAGKSALSLHVSNDPEVMSLWNVILENRHVQSLFSQPVIAAVLLAGLAAAVMGIVVFFAQAVLRRVPHAEGKNNIFLSPELRLAWVWFAGMLAVTLLSKTFFRWRYLTYFWVPATILFGALLYSFAASGKKAGKVIAWLGAFFGVLVIGAGLYYTLYLRAHMNVKDTAAFRIAQAVYADRFGKVLPDQKDLTEYYLGRPPAKAEEFDGMRVNEWDVIYNQGLNEADHERVIKERLLAKYEKWGRVYLAAVKIRGFEESSGARKIGAVSGKSPGLYGALMTALGRDFPDYQVYVWEKKPDITP